MTTENFQPDLTAICKAADSGYLLHVVRDGSSEPLAEKDLTHWPDWPTFPVDAAHAAGSELVMLGYLIWPDSVTADSLLGWWPMPEQRAWAAKVGTLDQLRAGRQPGFVES
ncbi:hypothetical protein OG333_37255 (plasmid) [Streptomyces anulatus]|uniref:hypothetical protein n=1 Tax=Streptomyces anulatus TaxID=1892 RepID=UPI002F91A4F8|nr:hypothetical protein OG333_37255 [Streptomyces anulatus]